jgi:large subunit ribosomal protein L23
MSNVIYDVIRTPVVTEKSTLQGEFNKVTFKVAIDADKPTIKKAIEQLFSVKVTNVNTIRREGKTKRFRGVAGKRNAFKKAIVTIAEGENIDVMGGIK